jgi:hypothetical protein
MESHVNLLSMDENSYRTSYPADVCTKQQKKRDDKYLTSYPDRKGRTRGFAPENSKWRMMNQKVENL